MQIVDIQKDKSLHWQRVVVLYNYICWIQAPSHAQEMSSSSKNHVSLSCSKLSKACLAKEADALIIFGHGANHHVWSTVWGC